MSNTINTRLILRNDTLANWTSSSALIYKGEAALALDSNNNYEIRIGIDTTGKTWTQLAASNLRVKASNVDDLANALYDYQLVEPSNALGTFKLQKRLHSQAGTDAAWTDVTSVSLSFADGTSSAGYSSENPIALKAYVDEKASAATNNVFIGIRANASTSDTDAISAILNGATPKGGDICIVKTALGGTSTQYSHKAFVYDTTTNPSSPVWQAMDGNYDWNTVYATENLTVTQAVGTITIPSSGSTTFNVAGKTVKQVFEKLLAQEKYPSTPTQPTASITLTNSGSKEAGTKITPAWKTTFTAGSYQYGPATGITSTAATAYHDSTSDSDADSIAANSLNNATGTFDEITVTDGLNYKAKLNWGSTAGATPVTNIGNDATVDQEGASGTKVSAIAAKSNQTATSSNSITGYYNSVYCGGIKSSKYTAAQLAADGSLLRSALSVDNVSGYSTYGANTKSGTGTIPASFKFVAQEGTKTLVIAVKGTSKTISSAFNDSVFAEMNTSFLADTATVIIPGAGSDTGTTYTVWTYSPVDAYGAQVKMSITLANA